MNRRQFTASSLAALAASPVLGNVSAADVNAATLPSPVVNFTSDGLDLSPSEYAAVLREMSGDIVVDDYSIGGTIERIEHAFADALGKPAAVWLPSGTLANHMALRALAGERRRVLVQAESHVYNDSGDGATVLSQLNLVPLGPGATMFDLAEAQAWTARTERGRVPLAVGAIAVESPVRRRDHEYVDPQELVALSAWARAQGIGLHLDAARGFNLAHHTGMSLREHAALFDTVMVSLWKHFNAKAGAILAGPPAIIAGMQHQRRMFGGSLPQAWPITAPALKYVGGYERDYAAAWQAADELFARLEASGRFAVRRLPRGTCRVHVTAQGIDLARFAKRAADAGVRIAAGTNGAGEFPMQVNTSLLRRTVSEVAGIMLAAAEG